MPFYRLALSENQALQSIELECVLVVALERRVLLALDQVQVADRERVELGAHEAAEGVLRRMDDGLAPHVEAGVDQHGQPVFALKAESNAWKRGLVSAWTVWMRAE